MRNWFVIVFGLGLLACNPSEPSPSTLAPTNAPSVVPQAKAPPSVVPAASVIPASSAMATPEPSTAMAPVASADATPPVAKRAGTGSLRVTAEETRLRVELPDGRVLEQKDLVGVILTARDESNAMARIRIDKVVTDPTNPDLTMYETSSEDPATKAFGPFCTPGPDGLKLAFPLAGIWTPDGRHLPSATHFNMTCTSGAIGKCVRFGYRPWAKRDGTALWDYHQACVRMMRADYCGDGNPFTRNGTLINLDDTLGIQKADPGEPSTFEAGWGPNGALCVHHPRIPENVTLEALEKRCPDHLAGRTGAVCTEAFVRKSPDLRTMNRSTQR